jgi:release factor glutamine methyltransferase
MPDIKTVSSLRAELTEAMKRAGISAPGLEADRLLCGALRKTRVFLHAHPEWEAGAPECGRAIEYGNRRASGEPLAYILNDAIFCGRGFFVDKRVLIPRPETETLTCAAGLYLKRLDKGVFADWCTGSGCVAVTLLINNPGFEAYAADVSSDALDVAEYNARLHGVGDRVKFVECADPAEVSEIAPGTLDLIVANPPYIPEATIETLEVQVRDYEPHLALDGGSDGLRIIKILLSHLPFFMKPGGVFFMETGGGAQVDEIAAISPNIADNIRIDEIFEDHRGIVRFMVWRKLS